ncbi:MAG: SPOR domain-containing protein [Desulfosalsimonas sp.]
MGVPQEKTGSRGPGGIFGRLLLFFFTSACMFVVGVLVGRNTAPVNFDMKNLDSKLSELEASVLADNKDREKEQEKIPEEISFEFYDKLKEKDDIDEYAAGRPRVLAPKYERPDPSEIQLEKTASEKPDRPERQVQMQEVRPSEDPEEQYAIQVASMRDPENAEKVREKFSDKGYPSFTKIAVVEGKGKWCRVRLGPYKGRKQAEDDLKSLQKAGVDAMIILND